MKRRTGKANTARKCMEVTHHGRTEAEFHRLLPPGRVAQKAKKNIVKMGG